MPRQRCMLSPMPFSLSINELATSIITYWTHGIHLFPDIVEVLNVVIYGSWYYMWFTINILDLYEDKWGMTVNLQKSNVVVFRRGGNVSSKEVYGGQILEVNTDGYLGLVLV